MRSTTPELSRSFQEVSLKVLSRASFWGSLLEGLKSGTARRTFSTPSPEPVRTQSWAKDVERKSEPSRSSSAIAPGRRVPDVHCRTGLCGSSIRVEPLREPGQKDRRYGRYVNIVLRYVLAGNLRSVITIHHSHV